MQVLCDVSSYQLVAADVKSPRTVWRYTISRPNVGIYLPVDMT